MEDMVTRAIGQQGLAVLVLILYTELRVVRMSARVHYRISRIEDWLGLDQAPRAAGTGTGGHAEDTGGPIPLPLRSKRLRAMLTRLTGRRERGTPPGGEYTPPPPPTAKSD